MFEGAHQDEPDQRTSERLVRDIIDGSPCAIFLKDEHGRFITINKQLEVLLRIDREELAGKTDFDLFPKERAEYYRAHDRQVLESGEPLQVEEIADLPDGKRHIFLSTKFPLRESSGRIYGVCGISQDVTAHKLAERILRDNEAHARIEQRLREADRRKDEFLAILAHELRNPLAAIRHSHYLLERVHSETEQATRARAVIGRQVQHLTRLVNDILDVTRIARGKVQLHRARLDLGELVRTSVGDHRSAVEKRGLTVEVRAPAEPVWVNGDQVRLAQAFENLLLNAVKFTDPGGRISVVLERNGSDAVVHVRDSGVGISSELLPSVFEPFVQADASLHRPDAGLGLGLALVKGILELHGGTVGVRSDGAGRGAEFTITLTEVGSHAVAHDPPTATMTASVRRVLLIEDNLDVADTLRDTLELDGHNVDVATDGLGGIEAARQLHPDIVLCDVGLPGVDGYEVARRLSAASGERPVLVALTGYASPDHVERARRAGFHHHLAKPVNLEKLTEILANAPARAIPGGSARVPEPPGQNFAHPLNVHAAIRGATSGTAGSRNPASTTPR